MPSSLGCRVPPMVTISTAGVPRTRYLLKTSDDLVNWTEGIPVVANNIGTVRRRMGATRKARYFRYVYEVETELTRTKEKARGAGCPCALLSRVVFVKAIRISPQACQQLLRYSLPQPFFSFLLTEV